MNKTLLASITSLAIVFSPGLLADGHKQHSRSKDNYIDYARVVRVQPIYQTVRVAVPEERCWQQEIQKPVVQRVSYQSPQAVVLGGLIGGAIGNGLASGNNKGVATIAGAIIGTAIASEAGANYYHTGEYRVEQRQHCRTHTQYRTEQQLMGYQVSYRYKGRIYSTQMNQHPGERIAVRVDLTPVGRLY